MLHDLLIDIVNKWQTNDLFILLLIMISFILSWIVIIALGFRILRVEIHLKHIMPGALINSFIALFLKPFIPGVLTFFIILVPPIVFLKLYGKTKWIIACWVAFLLLLSTAIFPILLVSPISNSNQALGEFLLKNRYGLPFISFTEALGAGTILIFLKIFNVPLIPSPGRTLTSIDFVDIYIFIALLFWCYRSTMTIWESPMQFLFIRFIDWAIAAGTVIAFYIHKVNNQTKLEFAANKIQELTDLKNQPIIYDTKQIKPNIHPDLENRERKIIRSIIEGKSNKEIAAELHLSEGRLGNAITPIYKKLGVESRVQLITFFVKNDLLDWISSD